jgi:GDP-L-fucose synthase
VTKERAEKITFARIDMLKGAKILVTGGAGFIASNLILRLQKEKALVRATIHDRSLQISPNGIEVVETDLRDLSVCRAVVNDVDYVFHCAANTSGAAVMAATPLVHVTPNVVMNTHLLEASYEAGVKKFIFISSGAAYPATGERPVEEQEMFDDDPEDIYFPVAWMKRYAEILCRTYATKINSPMSTLVVRPSNIYGPYDKFDFATSHVTAALVRRVVERQDPMEIWGTGNDIRDLIFISDFIEGLLLAVHKCDFYDEINICSGLGVTIKEILQAALRIEQCENADIKFNSNKPSTVHVRRLDDSKAKKRLRFEPKVGLDEGLTQVIAWYKENPFIVG